MSQVIVKAKKEPKRVVFAEAEDPKILKAAQIIQDEQIARPILLGNQQKIYGLIEEHRLELSGCTVVDPYEHQEERHRYGDRLFEQRKRKGVTRQEAYGLMRSRNYYGIAMMADGQADAFISGLTSDYPKTVLPALQIIGVRPEVKRVAGMYIISNKKGHVLLRRHHGQREPHRRRAYRYHRTHCFGGTVVRHGNRGWRCCRTPTLARARARCPTKPPVPPPWRKRAGPSC